MAKKQEEKKSKTKSNNIINRLANNIQNLLNFSYMNNYYNSTDSRKDLQDTANGINNALNNIIQQNTNTTGMSSLSTLYSSISTAVKKDEKQLEGKVKELFEDDANIDSLLNVYNENKYIRDQDDEIDMICKYMPQLEEALDILKENVLSSEQFNKEFMYINNVSGIDNKDFYNHIEILKTEYNLEEEIDNIYYRTSKYGEEFYYVKKYNESIADLLNKRTVKSKVDIQENTMIYENAFNNDINLDLTEEELKELEGFNLSIQMEHGRFITEAAINNKKITSIMNYSLEDIKKTYDDLKPDDKFVGNDGVTDTKDVNPSNIKVKGSIVKRLAREKVTPIYLDQLCLGYFYVDCDDSTLENMSKAYTDPTTNIKRTTTMAELNSRTSCKDSAIMKISSKIAAAIDVNFINTNQACKKDIYNILKYYIDHGQGNQQNMRITYIPPEDMFHFYFQKDPKTHRGISDLRKSIIPAKLYTCLYITNVIGIITRGQDKRAYYVKQSIDTNIASILLNTINQIKKGNFGMRDINNLTNFINVTGRYNDYIIPEGPNGDPPVRMEVIQGQDIQVKTELMEMLENMAVTVTGVPLEAVQTRMNQVDFASQITQNNGKLLKKAFKRQTKTENLFNPFLSKLYNNEFDSNDKIEMVLPPPKYLNNQQMDMTIENALNTKEKYISLVYGDNRDGIDPREIDLFGMDIMRTEYSGIIPWDRLDRAKRRAQIKFKEKYGDKKEE